MAISMLKIRRPLGRLIFNIGIAIPGETVLLRRPPGIAYHSGTACIADRQIKCTVMP